MTRRHSQARPQPGELAGDHEVDTGTASLVPDRADADGWSVVVNGVASSYVHLGDPTRLDFEYMQWTGHVLDVLAADAAPIDAVHLGGAGCTLARYVAATRPKSRQLVFEIDAALVTLARQAFGLRGIRGLRIRAAEGRAGLASLTSDSADVVVRDAFDGESVPKHLTTVGFHREAARVLRPGGVYVANVADTAAVRESRVEAAAAQVAFAEVALVAEPAQLRGRRFGNVLVVASNRPLLEDQLVRRLAGGAVRARFVPPERVAELVAGVRPREDPLG